MSLIHRVVLLCDSCGDEQEVAEGKAAPILIPKNLPKGWKANVVEEDCEYGHACPSCCKEIKEAKK